MLGDVASHTRRLNCMSCSVGKCQRKSFQPLPCSKSNVHQRKTFSCVGATGRFCAKANRADRHDSSTYCDDATERAAEAPARLSDTDHLSIVHCQILIFAHLSYANGTVYILPPEVVRVPAVQTSALGPRTAEKGQPRSRACNRRSLTKWDWQNCKNCAVSN
jgi:hypothetical protein